MTSAGKVTASRGPKTMEHFKSLSYDGFGINGRDEYRTRLATFAKGLSEEQRREFGPLFAAAPELLAALKAMHDYFITESAALSDNDFVNRIERDSMAAIAKAEGETI